MKTTEPQNVSPDCNTREGLELNHWTADIPKKHVQNLWRNPFFHLSQQRVQKEGNPSPIEVNKGQVQQQQTLTLLLQYIPSLVYLVICSVHQPLLFVMAKVLVKLYPCCHPLVCGLQFWSLEFGFWPSPSCFLGARNHIWKRAWFWWWISQYQI